MPNRLKIIKRIGQVDKLIQYCKQTKYCSFDFETTGFKYKDPDHHLLIMGVSFQPGSSWILPLGHKDSPFKDKWVPIFQKFGREVIEDPDIVKVAWNMKFEYKWCMRYDIFPKGRLFDSMLAKYCLDEERPNDLKSFVKKMFPEFAGYEDKLKGDDGKGVDWRNTDYRKLCKYCGIDTDTTLRGMILMEPKLIKQGFYSMFRNMFMMITRVLAESEYRGLYVDRNYLKNLMVEYDEKITLAKEALKNDPALRKYEKRYRVYHLQKLIDKVQLEIAEIRRKATPTADRLIANREKKINDFLEGKFSNKDTWDGMNFNSPNQVRHFFFEAKFGLRLKPHKYTKDKSGNKTSTPSTDEESLLALMPKDKTGFMKKLLDLRGLEKLDSTYIRGMYPHLDHQDRIHAGFKINGTVTGRLSCVDPNLQNIPRDTTAADIKRMFVPPPGYMMLEVDYSQAELRIIAELSGDEAMIEIFKKNYNIHVATACKMKVDPKITKLGGLEDYDKIKNIIKKGDDMGGKELEKPENKELLFWQKQKKKGKSLNFSIVYQQGDPATAETLNCTLAEAKEFKADWFRAFPKVEKWVKKTKRFAHEHEYVKNIFGTKRRLHDINSGVHWQMAEAERQAVNAPVQGGSGYFTLFSMVVIREKILKGELPRDLLSVYTVHDSIGYYFKPKDAHTVIPEIIKICDNPETKKYFGFELKDVNMKVSAELTHESWAQMKGYDAWVDYTKLISSY
jgi:DNA polymerase I-like protein with 3'-5' exonuclease and polymerase domains